MLLALLVDYDLLVLGTKEFGTAARPQSEMLAKMEEQPQPQESC